ncbi:MAG: hypothetical protein K2Y22_04400 [Candidatus Obscuribacterales bacterium]|nr:hypothetical protein [Candidatus Obscuribacterales bacterium]
MKLTVRKVFISVTSLFALALPVQANTSMVAPLSIGQAVQPIVQDRLNDTYSLIHPKLQLQPGVIDSDPLPPLKKLAPGADIQEIYRGPVEFMGTVDLLPGKETVKFKGKFKDRHPVVYKVFRKGRYVCIMFIPYLSATSMVAQIVIPFLL